MSVQEKIQVYVEKLTEYANEKNINKSMYSKVFGVSEGKRYTRIWEAENWGDGKEELHKCVFCFVDNEGNIYKPAGWAAPAKGIRGSILEENPPMTSGELYSKRYCGRY